MKTNDLIEALLIECELPSVTTDINVLLEFYRDTATTRKY